MSLLSFNPSPTVFDRPATVRVLQSPDVVHLTYTLDGSAPTLARNIAYDTLSPPNPFISTVQDGKGNCVFDGGFPKWYNSQYVDGWTTFEGMSNTYKYFCNALDFISNPNKPKKILFIGDNPGRANGSFPAYHVKDAVAAHGFNRSIVGACSIAGYEYEIISPEEFENSSISLSYEYLNGFSGVVVFGTLSTDHIQTLSNGTINNLVAFRESGNGILVITDHGDDLGTSGFFYNANLLARELGAEFRGNYNRTPVNVGYLIDNFGEHALWKNMSRGDSVYAGGSESRVVITERPLYTSAPDINIDRDGWTTVRYLIETTDGRLHLENYAYGLNVAQFTSIRTSPTVLNYEYVDYDVSFPSGHESSEVKGVIRHNSNVEGEFTRTKELLSKNWFEGQNIIKPQEGDSLELLITEPFSYFNSARVGRRQPPTSSISLSRLRKDTAILELSGINNKDYFKKYQNVLGTDGTIRASQQAKTLRDYINT